MAVSLVLLTGKVSTTVGIRHPISCISISSSLSTVYSRGACHRASAVCRDLPGTCLIT